MTRFHHQAIAALYRTGASVDEISRTFRAHPETVVRILQMCGLRRFYRKRKKG